MGIKEVIDFAYSHTDENFVIVDCQILEEVVENLREGTKPKYSFDEIESVADDIVETLPLDDEMKETLYKFIDEVETKLFKGEEIKESISKNFEGLLRELIHSIKGLNEYEDVENMFSPSIWGNTWEIKEEAERILKENGLKIK